MTPHEIIVLVRKKLNAEADTLALRNGESAAPSVHMAGQVKGLRQAVKIMEEAFKKANAGEDIGMDT